MILHFLVNQTEIVRSYQAGHKDKSNKPTKISSSSGEPIELIRKQLINEIEGMKQFNKELKKKYPDLLKYAKS
jgi:hypothetical protein